MAYTFSVNNTPLTGAVAIYTLISTLISAGWTQVDSSDGTTRGVSQVTSGASGTGGLANNSAWVRIRAPAVNGGAVVNQTRELTFQRGTSNNIWRIKYSASAGFSGGSPSATQTPSAADEVFMAGGGTDASPVFLTWFSTDNTYRWHVAAGGAAEFYSFVAWAHATGSPASSTVGMFLDVMATGSFPASDVDPAVMYVSAAANSNAFLTDAYVASTVINNVTNPAKARAWLGATSAAGAATTFTNNQNVGFAYGGTFGSTNQVGVNPFTGKDDMIPVFYVRGASSTTPYGWKGYSTLFALPSVTRTNMDTYDQAGTKDKVYFNTFVLPWSGAVPTI